MSSVTYAMAVQSPQVQRDAAAVALHLAAGRVAEAEYLIRTSGDPVALALRLANGWQFCLREYIGTSAAVDLLSAELAGAVWGAR